MMERREAEDGWLRWHRMNDISIRAESPVTGPFTQTTAFAPVIYGGHLKLTVARSVTYDENGMPETTWEACQVDFIGAFELGKPPNLQWSPTPYQWWVTSTEQNGEAKAQALGAEFPAFRGIAVLRTQVGIGNFHLNNGADTIALGFEVVDPSGYRPCFLEWNRNAGVNKARLLVQRRIYAGL